ncbi:hypothetical protein MHYP_G00159740 [Metynnis hypsauchen]
MKWGPLPPFKPPAVEGATPLGYVPKASVLPGPRFSSPLQEHYGCQAAKRPSGGQWGQSRPGQCQLRPPVVPNGRQSAVAWPSLHCWVELVFLS